MVNILKRMGLNLSQSAPFVLSNTIILVPYLLFISLSDGQSWLNILPFVFFYTFRMTGIFLFRGLSLGADSYKLLVTSLIFGGAGSFFGALGSVYFPLYILSGILLGLSAAWLQPANMTVNFHEKQQGFVPMTLANYLAGVVLLSFLFGSMIFLKEVQMTLVFTLYVFFYAMAFIAVKGYPNYQLKKDDQSLVSRKELIVFVVFFVLLLLLRGGRLLFRVNDLAIAIVVFSLIFILSILSLNKMSKKWHLPVWLNLLTFLTGMVGNFLILFGSLYVGVLAGFDQVTTHLYLPYVCGVVIAMFGIKWILRLFSKWPPLLVLIGGLAGSLLLVLIPNLPMVPWFMISFFRSGLGSWLNTYYYETEGIPIDQRLLVKFTTQNKGSLTHQFLLMTMIWVLAKLKGQPGKLLLELTGKKMISPVEVAILDVTKWLSIGGLLIGMGICLYLWKNPDGKVAKRSN